MIRPMAGEDTTAIQRLLEESQEAGQWLPRAPSSSADPVEVWVCELEDQAVGLIVARTVADETEILNLAVSPARRRQGVGGRLVEGVLGRCKERGARSVFLEVRESNAAARAFYRKHGFSEVGRRTGYYRQPEEDALVLSCPLF